jgi:peptide/nickel transport system permease protein
MARIILKRLVYSLVTLWLLVSAIFVLVRFTGDPTLMLEGGTDPAYADTLRQRWGLDQPYAVQYALYLRNLAHGDFGNSFQKGVAVTQIYFERLPNSLKLGGWAFLISIVIGVPLGVLAALRVNGPLDRLGSGFAVAALSVPNFVIGLVLILVFGVELNWLPVVGAGDSLFDWRHLIMPSVALGLAFSGNMVRVTRSSMLNVMNTDYIKLVRLKGVPERTVLVKHALSNALIPIITLAGLNLIIMVNVAVPIEVVFGWPGVGQLLFDGMTQRDFPLVQGVVLMAAIMVLTLNTVMDLAYAFIDPRIRVS